MSQSKTALLNQTKIHFLHWLFAFVIGPQVERHSNINE